MITFLCNSKTKYGALAAVLALTAVAPAQELFLAGSTQGAFNSQAFAATNTILGLTYNNSVFSNTTVGGFLDLGGNPNPAGNVNNLGSFTLASTDNVYSGDTFNLKINFTAPTGITGGSSTTFVDIIAGTVKSGNRGVYITFATPQQNFTYSNGTTQGSFTMLVNNLSISPGQSGALTAFVTGNSQSVPEPSALGFLGIGALGLSMRTRKDCVR
jgi:hypothetical protein